MKNIAIQKALRGFFILGPGLVIALTWLGPGDIVESSVAGGNYGYSLMWILFVAVGMRYAIVSMIAKYQLCNQHGEGILDGLTRFHPLYAPFLAVVAAIMGHAYCSYMTVGLGEVVTSLTGYGPRYLWSVLFTTIAVAIVFRPTFKRTLWVFRFFLGLLSLSILGAAIWVRPDVSGMAKGIFTLSIPSSMGPFGAVLVALSATGAISGSISNFIYPYLMQQKGWKTPSDRYAQRLDLLFAVSVLLVFNLAIWTLGVEILHNHDLHISSVHDLPNLLGEVIGVPGRQIFRLGLFSATFTCSLGFALGLAQISSHGYQKWRHPEFKNEKVEDIVGHPIYRTVATISLVSALLWTIPGMPGFLPLTLVVNTAQIVLMPILAIGVWYVTASKKCIGDTYKNNLWENLLMAGLTAFAIWGSVGSIKTLYEYAAG